MLQSRVVLYAISVMNGCCSAKARRRVHAAAVVCAGVPTAKTVYILAGEYRCEESLVAATVSMTTLCSIATLIVWMYALAEFAPLGFAH